MKKFIILVLLALLLPTLALAAPDEVIGNVTHVVDGDTFDIQIQSYDSRIAADNIRVRLADVDSPELGTYDGDWARDYAYSWLQDREVYLDLDDETGEDQYGRWVAVVYLADPDGSLNTTQNFNRMLVDSGNACVWDFSDNEFSPADWWGGWIHDTVCIKSANNSSDGPFVGSSRSNKYHYPSCSAVKQIKSSNLVTFSSSDEARASGYMPCGICNPP